MFEFWMLVCLSRTAWRLLPLPCALQTTTLCVRSQSMNWTELTIYTRYCQARPEELHQFLIGLYGEYVLASMGSKSLHLFARYAEMSWIWHMILYSDLWYSSHIYMIWYVILYVWFHSSKSMKSYQYDIIGSELWYHSSEPMISYAWYSIWYHIYMISHVGTMIS